MYEKGRYTGHGRASIKQDLQEKGHAPLLITEPPNGRLKAHSHPQLHILVVVEGEMRLKVEDKDIVMRPGDKIIIRPQQAHAAYFGPKGCKYFWIEE